MTITAAVLALALGSEAAHSGNVVLREQLARGAVAEATGLTAEREEGWATTWLEASPARGAPAGGPAAYGPFRLRDGDPRTAWCEGVPGDGVGEIVIGPAIRLDRTAEIRIGLGKSPALFAANGRPRRVRVHVLAGHVIGGSGRTEHVGGLRVIGTREVVLEDLDRFQPLPFVVADVPRTADQDFRAFLALELLEVTPGAKYHDTCISDVRQAPDPGAPREATRLETPWPSVLPCAAPSTVVCGQHGLEAEWVAPKARLDLSCGSGKVPTEPVDPSFATVVIRGKVPDHVSLRALCGEDEAKGEVSWSCAQGACSPSATYPIPDADGAEPPFCKAPVCTQLAAGSLGRTPSAKDVAGLAREGRVLARALADAVKRACTGGRCAPSIPEIGVAAGKVAASKKWELVTLRKATADDPTRGNGSAAVFEVSSPQATAAIICARGWEREGEDETGCALSLEWEGRRVGFSQDPDHLQQTVHEGTTRVNVDLQGSVSLGESALRLRGR